MELRLQGQTAGVQTCSCPELRTCFVFSFCICPQKAGFCAADVGGHT